MKKYLVLTFALLALAATGCGVKVNNNQQVTAGVYKSFDKGNEWTSKNTLVTSRGIGNIKNVSVNSMFFDPQDNNAVYMASNNGLLYSYDGGENWFQPNQLSSGTISSIAIDENDKCTIYASLGNRIMKSTDCSRSWSEIYLDTRPKNVSQVVIDPNNNSIVYAGTIAGELIKSFDGGQTWTTIHSFNRGLVKLIVDPANSGTLYAAIDDRGVFRSDDSGNNWIDLNTELKKFSGYKKYRSLHLDPIQTSNIYYVNRYGIIFSPDRGQSWQPLNLLTPPLSADIFGFGINPQNTEELFYVTATTFYKTVNGGENWSTKRLPLTAPPSYMLVDPVNPNIIYLGTKIPNT